MKNVIRSVSGLAACVVGILWTSSHAIGDFALEIDASTLREISHGSYEIDAFFQRTGSDTAPTVHSLMLNLKIEPANGYSLEQITGVQFNGLRNPDTNQIFASPMIATQHFGPLVMGGSLTNSAPVTTPGNSRLAFTVLFSTNNGTAADVQIKFDEPGNFYMIDRDNEGLVYTYNNLVSSSAFTVVRVPEPGSCLLYSIGLAGFALSRRFSKRYRNDKPSQRNNRAMNLVPSS